MREFLRGLRIFTALAWRADPRRTVTVIALTLVSSLFMSLAGLWLKLLTDGVFQQRPTLAWIGAVGAGLGIAGIGAGRLVATFMRESITLKASMLLEQDLSRLSAELPGIEHHERPDYLDRLQLLRGEAASLVQSGWSLLDLASLLVQVTSTTILLASLHPLLLVLPLLAVPGLWVGGRAQKILQRAAERTAEIQRLEATLADLCLKSSSAKEIRVFGLSDELDERCASLWNTATRTTVKAQTVGGVLQLGGSVVFTLGYLAAIAWIALRVGDGVGSPGDVALIVTVGQQVQFHAGGGANLVRQALTVSQAMARYRWLRSYSDRQHMTAQAPLPVPERLETGIELRGLSFNYPGTDAAALTDIDVFLPAGSTVAIVGENGAGKTTLVKLLCRFYRPAAGTITVDGVDLADLDLGQWRQRLCAGFQDFVRYEFSAQRAVGVGDLPSLDDPVPVLDALDRAGGRWVVDSLPQGLQTQLGTQFGGTDLSTGQWQRLALGRATLRAQPLLLVLDEPTSALDADAEHQLFARYTAAARDAAQHAGAITLLVSHRFSTVCNADLIIVVDGGRVVDVGDHNTLRTNGGLYAELYELQANAYR